MSGYHPLHDFWFLTRPKRASKDAPAFHGAFPGGFLERARAMLGVKIHHPVLHICGGKVRSYPYPERAVGPNDGTVDLDPATEPDFLLDVRELGVEPGDRFPWWRANVGAEGVNDHARWNTAPILTDEESEHLQANPAYLWDAALIDRPYTEADHKEYAVAEDVFPSNLNALLKRALSCVKPGGRVGVLDYLLPQPPRHGVKFLACAAVLCGFNNRIRCFSVFERVAPRPDLEEPASSDSEPQEAPLVEPTPEQVAELQRRADAASARRNANPQPAMSLEEEALDGF